MGKKKMVLYGAAALFAVSGVVALPSGNITGGIGCIVIAAVCFLLGRRPAKEAAPLLRLLRITQQSHKVPLSFYP